MDHILWCNCGEVIVKASPVETKIRGKVLVFRGLQGFAVCKGCGAEVKVPLLMDQAMIKSMTQGTKVPLYVKKKYDTT